MDVKWRMGEEPPRIMWKQQRRGWREGGTEGRQVLWGCRSGRAWRAPFALALLARRRRSREPAGTIRAGDVARGVEKGGQHRTLGMLLARRSAARCGVGAGSFADLALIGKRAAGGGCPAGD
ncbi:hypothetical protein MTO96_023970 [Rhipicephalus appendiculatus]